MIKEYNVKKFCCEDISKIENYYKAVNDKTQTWDCHHKMELIKTGAVVDSSKQDLIDWGIYFDRPADELIFLTSTEHISLHWKGKKGKPGPNKGKHHSEEWNRKISEAKKCKPRSEETRRKLSETHKGQRKGQHWKLVNGKRVWY